MLREQDYKRIKREVDAAEGDALAYLGRESPWLRPLEPLLRVSKLLELNRLTHVLIGVRALPFYGVPHMWGEIVFAVKELERFREDSEKGVKVLSRKGERVRVLDLVENLVVELVAEPTPLRWSKELEDHIIERGGVKVLSVEDYAVWLMLRVGGVLGLELSAKVLYANLGKFDEDYLRRRAEEYGVLESVEEILGNLVGD